MIFPVSNDSFVLTIAAAQGSGAIISIIQREEKFMFYVPECIGDRVIQTKDWSFYTKLYKVHYFSPHSCKIGAAASLKEKLHLRFSTLAMQNFS